MDIGSRLQVLNGIPVVEDAGVCDWLCVVELSNSDLPKGRRIREGLKWSDQHFGKKAAQLTMISAASVSCDDFFVANSYTASSTAGNLSSV